MGHPGEGHGSGTEVHMNIRRMAIDEIQIGPRRREELGGLEALAASIQQHGLIHPIVIDQDGTLVAGERRLKACQLLGWVEIDVRVNEDLTEEERWAIELEENLHRKDLTEYERSKTMMALVEMARKLAQQEKTGPTPVSQEKDVAAQPALPEEPEDFRSTMDRKSGVRGRPKEPGSYRDVAQRTGIPEATMKRAAAHVATVEKYPELRGMTQAQTLAIGRQLDQLPANEREQQRVALRQEASRRRETSPQQAVSATSSRLQQRRPRDPDRPWLKAMYSLWVFREKTRDRESVLAIARRWSRETVQRYLQEIRQVKAELIEWERTFEEMCSLPGAPSQTQDRPKPGSTRPARSQGERLDRAPRAPEDALASAPSMGDKTGREKLTKGMVSADHREQPAPPANPRHAHAPHKTSPMVISPHTADGIAPQSEHMTDAKEDRKGRTAHEDRQPTGSRKEDESHSEGVETRRMAILGRVKTLHAEGLSLRAIARRFNVEQVPTLHGEGRWDHRKIARLLEAEGAKGQNTLMQPLVKPSRRVESAS
jgi:ParB/RepB/Spo0J family partition protein